MDQSDGTDTELLQGLVRGDQRPLSILFDRHAAAVTRYAWALAPSRQDVEEIVQDTFMTLWRRADAVNVPEVSVLPWLLVTCRNVAANLARRHLRNRADELPEESASDHTAHARRDAEQAREQLRWVLDEIAALDPIDRRVCELCLVDGVPYADAARQLGLSVGAVKQRVLRSRMKLRKAVTADEN
ncbi:RNA polymerase sigma factor [Agromyces subbeticus]|uniref:RNA polymerase sigma factor n=1 Tax=Agromyces subbeticus TaxID=293890 RepID=UPI0003B60182|nr:sigma-70 family RNA polymerase sigma factor [Agromyces subbeticus]